VTLENEFGLIRLWIREVCDAGFGLALVFESEEDVIFTPKVADTLLLTTQQGNEYTVYYPGIKFTLADSSVILILVKNDNTEEHNAE
jgi:hypothetical protein